MNARLQARILAATRPTLPALDARLEAMADGRNALREAANYAERGMAARPTMGDWFNRAAVNLDTVHAAELETMDARSLRDLFFFAAGLVAATAVFVALGLAASYA